MDDVIGQDQNYWDSGLVEPGQECPKCQENRMDYLVWEDDTGEADTVACTTCGHTYKPRSTA